MTSNVDISVTPVYVKNKEAFDKQIYRVIANEGSTRSSKSYSICQLLVDIANGGMNSVTGEQYDKTEISMVSPSLPHLKKGVRKDTLGIIENLGIFDENDFNRTDQIYTFPHTGSYIEFFGVEDSGRVRGPGRKILYVNECNLVKHDAYIQLAMRTSDVIFIDYNPADEYSYVYEIADKPGNKKIHSTYKNNKQNLTKSQVDEIESLQFADENLWKVFGLGLRGTSSETIYTHWKTCKTLPGKGEQWYGLDFGYNVQSGLVKVELYEGSIYVQQVIYETKLTTGDVVERLKGFDISRSTEIFCDAAEPKTIEELIRAGYRGAKPADKDVTEGIRKVKSIPLYITEDSIDLLKEIRSYKWKTDKEGRVLDEPVKFHDHLMDALRYAVFTKLAKPTINWVAF